MIKYNKNISLSIVIPLFLGIFFVYFIYQGSQEKASSFAYVTEVQAKESSILGNFRKSDQVANSKSYDENYVLSVSSQTESRREYILSLKNEAVYETGKLIAKSTNGERVAATKSTAVSVPVARTVKKVVPTTVKKVVAVPKPTPKPAPAPTPAPAPQPVAQVS